jgi:drug/metabolite transporter (DMT)-like permease
MKDGSESSRRSVRGVVALVSGTLGATASCLAKLAFAPESAVAAAARALVQRYVPFFHDNDNAAVVHDGSSDGAVPIPIAVVVTEVLTRGLWIGSMIACNALMLGTFLEGMEESGSVAGTALTSAANFAVSALYGYILFGETFSLFWWMGFSMVVAGVFVLSTIQAKPSNAADESTNRTQKERKKRD